MKLCRYALLIVPLLVSGCGGMGGGSSRIPALSASVIQPSIQPPLNPAQYSRIVLIGDSITDQGGRIGGYVWQIDQVLTTLYPDTPISVMNAGEGGDTSRQMRERFRRDVLDRTPTLIVISAGINDVNGGFSSENPNGDGPYGVPLTAFRENLEAMAAMAREMNIPVVLFTPTIYESKPEKPNNARLKEYSVAVREIAAQHGLRLADQNLAFNTYKQQVPNARLTRDSVHMNQLGNTIMARVALLSFGLPATAIDGAIAEVNRERR